MVKIKNNYLITGNDNLSIDLFVSNFSYNKKLQKEEVLIINDSKFNIFTKIKKAKISEEDKIYKLFDLYSDKFIPIIHIKDLVKEIQDKQKKRLVIDFSNKLNNIIVISDFDDIYNDLYSTFDNIIIIINNEPNAINEFYKLIKKITNVGFKYNFNVIISNVKFIEDAIKIFNNLKNEITKLVFLEREINFLGFLNIDMQKLYISLRKGEIYIKIFNEDSFHGCVKLIEENLKIKKDVIIEDLFLNNILDKF